jgi:peptidoglycan/xylan/chitin deacetylase (PgdA/CDA1 family)
MLLSAHYPWISWQNTAGQTSVTLHSSPVDQLAKHSWSHFGNSSLITRDQLAEYSWSNFGYCPLIIHGSAGRAQLVALRLLYTHHPWVSWQSTTGHTSITRHSYPVDQLAENSCSHFCCSPLIISGSAGREQLVTLLLLSSHLPWIRWQSTAGHTFVTLNSSPVDQVAEHSWSHFCYSPFSLVDQLADHIWSHFCYSPLITRGSAGRLLLVTLLLLSTHNPWISWQSTAGHTSVTLHS